MTITITSPDDLSKVEPCGSVQLSPFIEQLAQMFPPATNNGVTRSVCPDCGSMRYNDRCVRATCVDYQRHPEKCEKV